MPIAMEEDLYWTPSCWTLRVSHIKHQSWNLELSYLGKLNSDQSIPFIGMIIRTCKIDLLYTSSYSRLVYNYKKIVSVLLTKLVSKIFLKGIVLDTHLHVPFFAVLVTMSLRDEELLLLTFRCQSQGKLLIRHSRD